MKIENTAFWKILITFQKVIIIVTGLAAALILFVETAGRPVGFNFSGYEEILVIIIFWLYMIGCAYGSYEESQITADILGVMLKKSLVKNTLTLLRYFITLVLGIIMFVWTVQLAIWAVEQNTVTSVYRIPTVVGYFSMPVGLGFTTFYNVIYFIREIGYFIRREDHPAKNNKDDELGLIEEEDEKSSKEKLDEKSSIEKEEVK